MNNQSLIYFDHAATTRTDPAVFAAMQPYFSDLYGNPSSIYRFAQKARQAVDEAREEAAKIFECSPRDILFTSGGTEANNLFIFGVAHYMQDAKKPYRHIITTKIEHDSVIKPCEFWQTHGFEVTYLDVDEKGLVSPADVEKALRPETAFISIIYANNEIGTTAPIAEIGEVIKKFRAKNPQPSTPNPLPYFHTDACQAAAYLPLSVQQLGVDAMTVNGGKIYGPKGVGALYIKEAIPFVPQLHGGGQEYRKRSGTENVPAIVGFAEALKRVQAEREKETARLLPLRDALIDGILATISQSRLNGDRIKRLPNNVNVSFKGLEGEAILHQLDMLNIAASSGSACTSGSLEPSHVIRALGVPDDWSHSATRFTLGHGNTRTEVDFLLAKLPGIINELRESSPFV